MSVARGYGLNGRGYYTNVAKPIDCNLNFIVDSTNGNGLGIRSLKSNGFVQNVFMHTSSTPGSSGGFLNPNPLAGFAVIQFKNNFNYYLGGFSGFVSPIINTTTSTTSGLTLGQAYVITVLGTTTLAEWQAIGLPLGLTPTVGQTFIAIATGTGGSHTGKVGTPSVSGVSSIEVVGDPNQTLNNSSIATNAGARIILQFLGSTVAATFTGAALGTHTHDFTVIGGQAASTTNNIANYAGPLIGKQEATNATYVGANSATAGGVVAASAGTPTGTIAGTVSYALAAPANGSVVGMCFRFDGSSVTIDGI